MSRQLSLFAPIGAAKPSDDVNAVAEKMLDGLYLGTSSWSFPGWEGIVYDKHVSQSVLARHGLRAYAQHPLFRTVCIDRTYYGSISKVEFADYADAVPEHFRFVVKAHEMLTRARTKDDFGFAKPCILECGLRDGRSHRTMPGRAGTARVRVTATIPPATGGGGRRLLGKVAPFSRSASK